MVYTAERELRDTLRVEDSILTTVYHMAYEPSYGSLDIHFYTHCNLSCRACYANYELNDFSLLDDPTGEMIHKHKVNPPTEFLSLEEVRERLKGLDIRYVILVGTEPSLDPSLPEVTRMLKEDFGSYNMLLTNGVKLTDMSNVDEVMFSLKALTEDIYEAYTGRSNKKVLDNLKKIYETGKKLQVETVLIPTLIDEYEIERIAEYIASIDPEIPYRIDAYFRVPDCPWEDASNEEVERAASLARKHLKHVSCLTLDMKRIGDKALRIV